MKKICLIFLFSISALNAFAEDSKQDLPPALTAALKKRFPDSEVFLHSPECKSDTSGYSQFGIVLGRDSDIHAIIATAANSGWVVSDLPKHVEYRDNLVSDFLDEYTMAENRERLEVRCADLHKDSDISTEANGAFIKHRGENAAAKHLCFAVDSIYNSWICYWTKPQTDKPELSFFQLNAD